MKKALNDRNIKIMPSPTPIIPIYTNDQYTTLALAKAVFEEYFGLNETTIEEGINWNIVE